MEAIGPLLVVLSLPLMLRWIPRNRYFGLRIPATLRDAAIWYEVNALWGRHLFVLGVLMVTLEFVLPRSMLVTVLAGVGWIGFIGILIADWRTANRWQQERRRRA